MHVLALRVTLQLEGCHSLKEKRARLAKLKAKVGRHPNVAVCESGHQDVHGLAEYAIVAAASDASAADRLLAEAEQTVATEIDARVVGIQRWAL